MDDGESVAAPSQSDIPEDEKSSPGENEDSEISKHTLVREQTFSSSDKNFSDQNSFRNFAFSNVNGDCVEKNVNVSEPSGLVSSSTNSLSSMYSEITRSIDLDETSHLKEGDLSSENDSKSSSSDTSERRVSVRLQKSEDSFSETHPISSELSESSSDSDSSESESSFVEKDDKENIGNKSKITIRLVHDKSISSFKAEKDLITEEKSISKKINAPRTGSVDKSELVEKIDQAESVKSYSNLESVENPDLIVSSNPTDDNVMKTKEELQTESENIMELGETNKNSKSDTNVNIFDEIDVNGSKEPTNEKEGLSKSSIESENVQETTSVNQSKEENIAPRQEQSEKTVKSNERPIRSTRRKTDDKGVVNDSNPAERFPIQYKGFKKSRTVAGVRALNKTKFKGNPFNPAWRRNSRSLFGIFRGFREEIDYSTLQPEYAQYLGLQPIVKFKCSNCGMSTFQTMSALNTHQVECKKNGKLISHNSEIAQAPDANSANIKLTRKVFLCSTCGTYYENCDLFLHMREFHRRYICLYCLYMAQSPEILQEHLQSKHKVVYQSYLTLEELQRNSPQAFYLLCLRCDRVFAEMDDSVNHKCSVKSLDGESNNLKKLKNDSAFQDRTNDGLKVGDSTGLVTDICQPTTSPRLIKDVADISLTEDKVSQNSSLNSELDSGVVNVSEKHEVSFAAENLQLKVPSGIEIKPLVPGEKSGVERKEVTINKAAIEIFPIPSKPKKIIKKGKKIIKKTITKRVKFPNLKKASENVADTQLPTNENEPEASPGLSPPPLPQAEPPPAVVDPPKVEQMDVDAEKEVNPEEQLAVPLALPPAIHNDIPEVKRPLSQDIFNKIKLPGEIDSDGESDDSQKLSLVVDENTNNSDTDLIKNDDNPDNDVTTSEINTSKIGNTGKTESSEVALAREDVAAMALTLDDKIENVPIQAVLKECVRTSCLSCNYCRHAVKIAVNGKQLALHLLSEHRYTPVKNETHDDVVRKLLNSLEILKDMHFNAETYDSSDPSIHVPYDQDRNFDCFQCSYVSSSHKDLYAHKRKFHTKSLLLCIMCKSNFYSYSELICHICTGAYNPEVKFHNVDINFRCCFCRLDTIPSAFRLMVHLRKSHHTCDICLEMCSDQQKLSTHMWKHKLNHLCYRCGIAYGSKPDITKHLFWKHGTESVLCKKCLQKKWPHVYHFCIPPTSFICEECNTSFSKAVALKVHKRIHGNDYPYSCGQCEKKFVSKKLLSRHIDRHKSIAERKEKMLTGLPEDKEEIINVTDLNDGKESSQNEHADANKEADSKDKSHKKHKKEKEKKEKKVVDVYDLPPLNLSSESDSSDEEPPKKTLLPSEVKRDNDFDVSPDNKLRNLLDEKVKTLDMPKLDGVSEGDLGGSNGLPSLDTQISSEAGDDNVSKTPLPMAEDEPSLPSLHPPETISAFDSTTINSLLPLNKDEEKMDVTDSSQNNQVEGIWENFYKTNPQNSNLPFPLCAMKPVLAYSIIMGDHDYCQQAKTDPIIKEDLPSTSNLDASLSDDKLEEITPIIPEKPQTPPMNKLPDASTTPVSLSKKKLKSPKKKLSKTPDENNSSSSSDSSSDSDSSSCSCGTNCSCSSSSNSSSSSSSSDSDSSTNEDKSKQDKRKKRKDKRAKPKSESEAETVKETQRAEPEVVVPMEPEDPPIHESELETDETTSDEEFYDRQPQIIANQLLAEKRQLVVLASGAPVNNGNASLTIAPPPQDTVLPLPSVPDPVETPKTTKAKTKRKRKLTVTPKTPKVEKPLPLPSDPYPKFVVSEPKPYSPFQQSITTPKQKPQLSIPQSPSLPEAGGSGSETDNTRLSKRRRVPNKFYGYSSGEEEEVATPKQPPKWKKMEHQSQTPVHTPKPPPSMATLTPRIQLTVPKQVIRKPTYHKSNTGHGRHQSRPVDTSSDSSDSAVSDIDDRLQRPAQQPQAKADKDVYCYCRCPYDEVSEMIACDDANCKIEWFHFECVGILVPPRGQWFCPGCRKARGLPT